MTAKLAHVSADTADVYKGDIRAATLRRVPGAIEFQYLPEYLADAGAVPVATSLPLADAPTTGMADGVPAFFAGLLPEGRRLSALRRSIKASADDDFSLLLAIGADTVGDVRVVPAGSPPDEPASALSVRRRFDEISFAELLGEAGIVDRVGLPGVQDKASLRMISLPIAQAGKRFILKLDPTEYPHVVANEHHVLGLARKSGIPAASAKLVHDREGRPGLLVERFDRGTSEDGRLLRYAVEDATQVLGLYPRDKYELTTERAAGALMAQCAASTVAARDLFRQIVFAWVTGNGDQHGKNLAIVATAGAEWRISPMYDVPSTLPYGDVRAALSMGGRKDGLSRRRFLAFADRLGLPGVMAGRILDDILSSTATMADELASGALPFDAATTRDVVRVLRFRRRALE